MNVSNKNKNPDRVPGTCEWFLQHSKFRKWSDEKASTWLWVTADPGCGKSVLSKFLVNNFQNDRSPKRSSICYYFFKDDSEENRSAVHALCAILHQLFSQNEALLKHAMPDFQRNGQKLSQLFDTLWKVFMSAITDPDAGSVICILDALDECSELSRRPLMRKLARFYLNPEPNSKLKFILTSRPDSAIGDALWSENRNVASIQLMGENENELEAIRSEIDLVIKKRVKQFYDLRSRKGVDDDAHIAIQEQLDKIENRTYLWVALLFPELERNAGIAKAKLLKIIQAMPSTINEAYEGILARSSDTVQAEKLLHIVVAAVRPLTLTEMNVALSIRAESKSMDELELEPEPSFEKTIRELCGLFVTIKDSRIYLIHQTAKDFLVFKQNPTRHATSEGSAPSSRIWKHSLDPTESNLILARICISYLMFDVFGSSPSDIDESVYNLGSNNDTDEESATSTSEDLANQYTKQHILLDYAAHHWSFHYSIAEVRDDTVLSKQSTALCDVGSERFRTWAKIHWPIIRFGELFYELAGITELMLRSMLGHEAAVKVLLDGDVKPNVKEVSDNQTALLSAVVGGHNVSVAMLHEQGADISMRDSRGFTPLHYATQEGQEKIVKILLEKGANANVRCRYGHTPLVYAIEECQEKIVAMLLDKGANVNIYWIYHYRETIVHGAVQKGNENIVAMLLEKGAGRDTRDSGGQTPLMTAARAGHKEIMKTLLTNGANANAQDSQGDTPLMLATKGGHENIIELLIEKGASPNLSDFEGKTPLMCAVQKGYEKVVRLLLEKAQSLIALSWMGQPHFHWLQ